MQEKVNGLHPTPRRMEVLSERSLRSYNGTRNKSWGNGGLSDRIAHIHFAAVMTLLLKPRGRSPGTVYTRLTKDWASVRDDEWTVRPIAAGNAHDRLINRARLWAITKEFVGEFVSEGLVQLAFGTKRGTAVAFMMHTIHKELFPEDDHDTECCDGTNAYNIASRVMVAKAMLTAKSRKIRRQYGYFLMGHRLHSKIYIRGSISVLTLSKMGVRQGDPYAGFGYSLGQMNMLDTMREELGDKVRNVIITCVVDDVKIQGPVEQRALVNSWLRVKGRVRKPTKKFIARSATVVGRKPRNKGQARGWHRAK